MLAHAHDQTCIFFLKVMLADLTYQQFTKIRKGGAAYDGRWEFEARLQLLANASQADIEARIMVLDPDRTNPSFAGGYGALLAWYNNLISGNT